MIDLVIRLSEEVYDEILSGIENAEIAGVGLSDLSIALKNGTPLPKGHGRLFDADALEARDIAPEAWYSPMWGFEWADIEDAPTIIEADKEGAEE